MEGYLGEAPSCTPCYWYGDECVSSCPSKTTKNEKYMTCDKSKTDDLSNNDDIVYIITTIILIILVIGLTLFLFRYFYKLFA